MISRAIFLSVLCLLIIASLFFSRHQDRAAWFKSHHVSQNHAKTQDTPPVLNNTLGFQKIFILTGQDSKRHKEQIQLTASLTNLTYDIIEGVGLKQETSIENAHLKALQAVVDSELASALIIHETADWDVRIATQLSTFAQSANLLLQPIAGTTDRYLDVFWPRRTDHDQEVDIPLHGAHAPITAPTTSVYGDLDRWDLLWLGHRGSKFPNSGDAGFPLARVVIENDETAMEMRHFDRGMWGSGDFEHYYDNFTRVVSHAKGTDHALAYAVSLDGARKFLKDLQDAIKGRNGRGKESFDDLLAQICDGRDGHTRHECLSVVPPLFSEYQEGSKTKNVRWSARGNLARLGNGGPIEDSWPAWSSDEEEGGREEDVL